MKLNDLIESKNKKYMTIEEYVNKFNGAPWDDLEVAEHIRGYIDPNSKEYKIAQSLVDASNDFRRMKINIGFEN